MRLVTLLLLAGGLLAVGAVLLARGERRERAASSSPGRAAGAESRPAPVAGAPSVAVGAAVAADLERLRDVFRYADEPSRVTEAAPRLRPVPRAPSEPPAQAGPRLVGVVRRGGRLLAALSQDGEVELAAAGETAAGALVLSVAEDGVRLRLPDGSERSLQPPE